MKRHGNPRIFRNFIADSRMLSYPSSMVLSIFPGRTVSLRAERFLVEFIYNLMDSESVAEDRQQINASLAAELEDVRLSRQGDSDAYTRLIKQHQPFVSRILWRFSRDRLVHEELVQDVFVEAYLSLGGYRQKAPFGHWLARIATRVGYHYWKQQARRGEMESFSLAEWDQLPDKSPEEMDPGRAADVLHRLLAQLKPRDRLVLTLRYLEGCDVAETARRTGWTKSLVKVQSKRARKRLEKLFVQAGKGLTE
jgi:RNA polymerase sigma factor (sigma-70 family)